MVYILALVSAVQLWIVGGQKVSDGNPFILHTININHRDHISPRNCSDSLPVPAFGSLAWTEVMNTLNDILKILTSAFFEVQTIVLQVVCADKGNQKYSVFNKEGVKSCVLLDHEKCGFKGWIYA